MEPRTLRRIGNVCLAFGVLGLAFSVAFVALVAAGAEDPTSMTIVILVQSVVNVLAGWNLRRQASEVAR